MRILDYPDPPVQQKAPAEFGEQVAFEDRGVEWSDLVQSREPPVSEEEEEIEEADREEEESREGEAPQPPGRERGPVSTSTREQNGWHVTTTHYRRDDTEVVEITQTPTDFDSTGWIDKIVGTIPVEIVTAWLFIEGVSETGAGLNIPLWTYWGVFAVVTALTLLYLLNRSTLEEIESYWGELALFVRPVNWRNRRLKTRMLQVLIGTGAFVVWAIYLGGPFDDTFASYNKSGAIVLVVIFTTALPLFIPTASIDEKLRLKPLAERLRVEATGAVGAVEEEYVTLRNRGSQTIDLSGWTIRDEDGHSYTVPVDTQLRPGAKLSLHSGDGRDTRRTRYWNATESVWDRRGETITITDGAGNTIEHRYR